MSIAPGTRLGPYEVTAQIGEGGMGEVYRAKDTRLDRIVAIKILPIHLASDPQFRDRFDREARAISQLEHPHICALYDVGKDGGTSFLVMQHLEGETLAERLARAGSGLPIDEALSIAIQIASALDRAHRAGITHRDLKPGNVMLTKSGAKLLDFGLAKATAPAVAGELSMLPTTPANLTVQGTILGTFQYMAPEQLEGAEADARTDVFAFGAVLYEMLTGKKAFEGKSQASLIGAILEREPQAVSRVVAAAPPALDRVVAKCLAKDPDARWQSARDLQDELAWVAKGGGASAQQTTAVASVPHAGLWRVAAVVLGLTAVVLAAVVVYDLVKPTPVRIMRFQVGAPENTSFSQFVGALDGANGGTVSPDGSRLVFAAADSLGKPSVLWIRPIDSLMARPLSGTEGAELPFWSPDSRVIGFFASGKLKKIDAAGGPPQTICDAAGGARGATWGSRGAVLFATSTRGAIFEVPAEGGQPKAITTLDRERKETGHLWPSFLPDGRAFLYLALTPGDEPSAHRVYVASTESGASRSLLASETNALYSPPGFVLFMRDGTLMRQGFDAAKLELQGEAVPVAEQISRNAFQGLGAFSVSRDVLTFRASSASTTQFAWIDRAGKLLDTVGAPGTYAHPALSPDEKRLAFRRTDQQSTGDLWLLDLVRQTLSRFTFNRGSEVFPIWSPDGQNIIYASDQDGSVAYYEKSVAGTGAEQQLTKAGATASTLNAAPAGVSRDGKALLYMEYTGGPTGTDIFVLPLMGERKPIPVVQTPFTDAEPQFSPDGRWIAYASNDAGQYEVYVQPFPARGAKWQISSGGGRMPTWRGDGKELFFVRDDRKFFAVAVNGAGSSFEYGAPQFLFDMRAYIGNVRNSYVPSRDGQRFLVNQLLDTGASSINVVVNWAEDLSAR